MLATSVTGWPAPTVNVSLFLRAARGSNGPDANLRDSNPPTMSAVSARTADRERVPRRAYDA
jgi:hypothetical protein